MSEVIYPSSKAAKLAGISDGSLRNYAPGGRFGAIYSAWFSAGAAPPPGKARQFTESDITVLRYIRERSQFGVPHVKIAEEIRNGALESFDWQPPAPEETAQQARSERSQRAAEDAPPPAALVAVQEVARQLTAVMSTQLEEARSENAVLRDQVLDAEKRAAAAEARAGMLEAQLAERKRGLFARIFGR